jgi:hypothetical protein
MPEIVKQLVVLGIAGMMAVLRGYTVPPPSSPAAAEVIVVEAVQQADPLATLTSMPATPSHHGEQLATPEPANSIAQSGTAAAASAAVAAPARRAATAPPSPAAISCRPIPGQAYGSLSIRGGPTNRPAAEHADLNLGRRAWRPVNASLALQNLGGPTDGNAPRFSSMFAPSRFPRPTGAYQVYNWDFGSGRRTTPIGNPEVTLVGFATTAGEIIRVPNAGYSIGSGYAALVLYAEPSRITLKYTREDNVAVGYTLHLENVCVEPRLLALYRALNSSGRRQLPAVGNGQPLASAAGSQILVGIQDSGTWMDPRSRKDWWQ